MKQCLSKTQREIMTIQLLAVNATTDYDNLFESAMAKNIVNIVTKTTPEKFNDEIDSGFAKGNKIILMKGLIETADFMRLVLKRKDLRNDTSFLSHCGIFEKEEGGDNFIITDAALNMYPNAETKIKIAENALSLYKNINFSKPLQLPKISALTPAGKPNPKIPSSMDANIVAEQLSGRATVVLDQLDTALSTKAMKTKGREDLRPADILLCHDLDSGNVLYHALTEFAGFSAAGLIIGANVPICVTSRTDTMKSKLLSLQYAAQLSR